MPLVGYWVPHTPTPDCPAHGAQCSGWQTNTLCAICFGPADIGVEEEWYCYDHLPSAPQEVPHAESA
jgi:hypothetical protein